LSTVAMPEEDHVTHKKNLSYIEALGKHTIFFLKRQLPKLMRILGFRFFVPWFSHRQ
jgi:hypothetical protein